MRIVPSDFGGADGIRTHDLLDAIEARSQLRHGPTELTLNYGSTRTSDSSTRVAQKEQRLRNYLQQHSRDAPKGNRSSTSDHLREYP